MEMTTIQLTVDESLLEEIDRATREFAMTRADFIQTALEMALRNKKS